MVIAPAQAARIARALWIVWAVIVWNVVFDHVIVVAGRQPIGLNIDELMRPALASELWIATVAAAVMLFVGLSSIRLTTRPQSR